MRISDWSSDVCSSDLFDGGDLDVQLSARRNGLGIVVGHLDHGRDTACRRGAGSPAQPFLVGLAAGMHLAVEDAGNDPHAPGIDGVPGLRGRAFAPGDDLSRGYRDPAVMDNTIGFHDISPHYQIKIAHYFLRSE